MQLSSYEKNIKENIIFNKSKEYKVKDSKKLIIHHHQFSIQNLFTQKKQKKFYLCSRERKVVI